MTAELKKQIKGFSLLEILLVLGIIGIVSVFAIGISHSLKNMSSVSETSQRMKLIAAKAKDYYRGHESLPDPTSTDEIPVGASALDLEQKYRLDSWGQYLYYYRISAGGVTDINGTTVDGKGVAGVIISSGPNQTFDSFNTASPPTTYPEGGSYTVNDDIIMPINVHQEAVEIALAELKVLQDKVKAFDALYEGIDNDGNGTPDDNTCLSATQSSPSCPPISNMTNDPNCGTATLDLTNGTPTTYGCNTTYASGTALDVIVGYYSLSTAQQTDPWGNNYVWGRNVGTTAEGTIIDSTVRWYHKFYSQGPSTTVDSDDILP